MKTLKDLEQPFLEIKTPRGTYAKIITDKVIPDPTFIDPHSLRQSAIEDILKSRNIKFYGISPVMEALITQIKKANINEAHGILNQLKKQILESYIKQKFNIKEEDLK